MHTGEPQPRLAESLQAMYEKNEILWDVPEVAWAALALSGTQNWLKQKSNGDELIDAAPRPFTDSFVFQAAIAGRHQELSYLSVRYRRGSS